MRPQASASTASEVSGGLRFMEEGRLGFAVKEALTPAIIGKRVNEFAQLVHFNHV